MALRTAIVSGAVVVVMAGCGSSGTSSPEGGTDGETSDAAPDVGMPDVGGHEASTPESGTPDGSMSDGSTRDGGDAGAVVSVAFLDVVTNQELETGFIIGTASGPVTQVGCKFDGGAVVVATGTTSWKCPRPTTWKLGSKHVVTAGGWNGATLGAPVTATVYAAQNHDFNGDGYTDLALGAPDANSSNGTVSIFYGSPSGIANAANVTISAPSASSMFGYALVAADLRNSGYADLVVGVASFNTSFKDPGTVYFYDGGSNGLSTAPSYQLAGPALNNAAGGYSLAAGDYDGDGYQDVAVGYGAYNLFQGAVSFYKGGATGATIQATKLGTSGQQLGNFVSLGDFSGTGYASAAIGVSSGTLVFAGGPTGFASTPSVTLTDSGALNTAYIERNGFADLVVTGNAVAVVHSGSASGPGITGTSVSDPNANGWGTVVPGDVDLDGHDDVVFANPCRDATCTTGNALVFLGSGTGISTTVAATLSNPGTTSEFGYSLGMGDLNGDGRFDLCVGTNAAFVYVFNGAATGLFASAPGATLTGLVDVAFSPR